MTYHFRIHSDERGGYWAECLELQGCRTQGKSKASLEKNMASVLNLFLSEPETSRIVFPSPDPKLRAKPGVVGVHVEASVAFATLLRKARLKRKISIRDAAKALGMKNHYSYQKLEMGGHANPELKTLAKIKEIFPDVDLDEALSA